MSISWADILIGGPAEAEAEADEVEATGGLLGPDDDDAADCLLLLGCDADADADADVAAPADFAMLALPLALADPAPAEAEAFFADPAWLPGLGCLAGAFATVDVDVLLMAGMRRQQHRV